MEKIKCKDCGGEYDPSLPHFCVEDNKNTEVKNKKNILPITWIICGMAVLVIAGVLVSQIYQHFQQQKIESEQKIKQEQEQIMAQKKAQDKLRDQQFEDLENQVNILKNRPPEIRTETKTIVVENKDTTADITKEWSPRIAYIECTWAYSNTGVVYERGSGSATIIKFSDGILATTTKHAIVDEEGQLRNL